MMTRKKYDPCRAARSPLGGSLQSLRDSANKEADTLTGAGHYSTGHLVQLIPWTSTIASDSFFFR